MSRSIPGIIGMFFAVAISIAIITRVKFISDLVFGKA